MIEATGHYHLGSELGELFFEGGWEQPLNVMANRGDGHFQQVRLDESDGARVRRATRGIALADLDDDGRVDVVLAPASGRPALLRNRVETTGHFLRVRLIGAGGNRAAAGARVTAEQGRLRLLRERRIGEGYLGSFDPRLHFGFPDAGAVTVEVQWRSGDTQVVTDVPVDGEITIREVPPPG
jgi:hypothetical protein